MKKNLLLTVFSIMLLMCATESEAKTIELSSSNTLVLNQKVTFESVSKVLDKAFELSALNPDKDLYLVLDSPGGSVIAGMSMLEGLAALPNKIHTITYSAASMAYQTVQNLDNRYITKHGYLMSHRAYLGGIAGQIPGELETRIKFYKELLDNLDKDTSARLGMTKEDYAKLIHDEYWVVGQNAVDAGHADAVVDVRCSKELIEGRSGQTVYTMFGAFRITWSNCPIIRFPLSIKPASRTYDLNKFKKSLIDMRQLKNVEFSL